MENGSQLLPAIASVVVVITGCAAPSQQDLDAFATQVAANVYAAETAEASTPAPTEDIDTSTPTASFTLQADGSGDFPTLEEALRRMPEGAILTLGPGTHRVTNKLNAHTPIHLVGAGMDATEIVSDAEGYVFRFTGTGPFIIEDITFRHEGERTADVVAVRGGEIRIARCRFTGGRLQTEGTANGIGLWIHGETTGIVQDSIVEDNAFIGIHVAGNAQPILERNRCTENADVGIYYWGTPGGEARENTCSGNKIGIAVGAHSEPTLEGNTCDDNAFAGLLYGYDAGGAATENECQRNEYGILVGHESRPKLERNVCNENTEVGIEYVQNSGGTALANECLRNAIGILVADQAQPTLESNACNENGWGIVYTDNAGGIASQNECAWNTEAGIGIKQSANPSVMGNDCHDNSGEDIQYVRP